MEMRCRILLSAIFFAFGVKEVFCDWIDPDTPDSVQKTYAIPIKYANPEHPYTEPSISDFSIPNSEKREYTLVMSDEFNVPHRNFTDGADPKWTAMNKNDYTNDALHFYSHEQVTTNTNGELVITSEVSDTDIIGFDDEKFKNEKVTKHFKSGMLQSWNKFCFTGGIVEIEAELPGRSNVGGLWPSFWLLGNLARHTFLGTASHVWPFSSSICNESTEEAQLVNGCMDLVHYGLEPGVGRGAPEIDIFEVQPGDLGRNRGQFLEMNVGQPFMSASYQVAPGKSDRPGDGYWPAPGVWYEDIRSGMETNLNILFYGTYNFFRDDVDPSKQDYWSDAISYNRQLNDSHFRGKHKYRLEWDVPNKEKGTLGYLRWFLDGNLILEINGETLAKAETGGEISSEPSSVILNTAISSQWGFDADCDGSCPCKNYDCRSPKWGDTCGFSEGFCAMMEEDKPEFKINWIRVYQDPDDETQKVGCSTPERPTKTFIEANADRYKMPEDEQPLKDITQGRGKCTPALDIDLTKSGPNNCGGSSRGVCTIGNVCECKDGWTGPFCQVPFGSDPINWEIPQTLNVSGPSSQLLFLSAFIFTAGVVMVITMKNLSTKRKGYVQV